jgi:hypothetical protein
MCRNWLGYRYKLCQKYLWIIKESNLIKNGWVFHLWHFKALNKKNQDRKEWVAKKGEEREREREIT